jgi:hypothetical protein
MKSCVASPVQHGPCSKLPVMSTAAIPRVESLSLGEFLRSYAVPNAPVLVRGASARWRAAREWVTPEGAPDVRAIAAAGRGGCAGAALAPVATCVPGGAAGYGREPRCSMRVSDFADKWLAGAAGSLYLKDWHYFRDVRGGGGGDDDAVGSSGDGGGRGGGGGGAPACRGLRGDAAAPVVYEVPLACCDDWLNWFWDRRSGPLAAAVVAASAPPPPPQEGVGDAAAGGGGGIASPMKRDDFRFVYLGGGGGTSTPMHVDVLYSHSWTVNVAGRKRWVMFSPAESLKLYDRFGVCVADVSEGVVVDSATFPLYASAARVEAIQEAGEVCVCVYVCVAVCACVCGCVCVCVCVCGCVCGCGGDVCVVVVAVPVVVVGERVCAGSRSRSRGHPRARAAHVCAERVASPGARVWWCGGGGVPPAACSCGAITAVERTGVEPGADAVNKSQLDQRDERGVHGRVPAARAGRGPGRDRGLQVRRRRRVRVGVALPVRAADKRRDEYWGVVCAAAGTSAAGRWWCCVALFFAAAAACCCCCCCCCCWCSAR